MMRRWVAGAFAVSGWLLTGCASAPTHSGFGDVQQTIAARSGQRVVWRQASSSDEEVAQAVSAMLQPELTADAAVQIGLLNNRNLQATYEDIGLAQAELVQAGLLKNPVFSADVRFFGSGPPGAELSIMHDFVDTLLIPLRTKAAGAALEAAKLRVSGAILEVAGEVRAHFYALQAAEQTREMRQTVLDATSASYDLAKRLHAAGNITDLDLANERALYEQSKLDLAQSEAESLLLRERLNSLMGLWGPDTAWHIAPRLPELPTEEIAGDEVEKRAVSRSLDLAEAQWELEVAAQRLGLARPLAVLSAANVGVTTEGEHPEGFWGVGPAFSLPIPIFDVGQAAAAGAEPELRRKQERYYALAVDIRAKVRSAWTQVSAARGRAQYYTAVILPLRREIVEETQKEYNAMLVGAFQLLSAKQQEIDAGSQYVGALGDYWLARTELDQLLAGKSSRVEPEPRGVSAANGATYLNERGFR